MIIMLCREMMQVCFKKNNEVAREYGMRVGSSVV